MVLDWNNYCKTAIQATEEGCVLLKNKNNTLPLEHNAKIAIYGRIQLDYYKSGSGSGGMVNVSKVVSILDALIESKSVEINQELLNIYKKWVKENPFDQGVGWGAEPFSQKEMELSQDLVKRVAQESEIAVVIIGRSAGEDKDSQDIPGAYRLSETEYNMLQTVRQEHKKMIVLLNVGGILDLSWEQEINPDAVMFVWQGGMLGGYGASNILTGKTCPSGKLSDTIAYHISDYPASSNFGNEKRNIYAEDIYVGYRYFETFAPEKVQYPFGFGLSYTTFEVKSELPKIENSTLNFSVMVTNTGKIAGKEVVQVYLQAPQGKLGKSSKSLIAFQKTKELAPEETQQINFSIPFSRMASYDDSGITGNPYCYVLEEGTYNILLGTNVRDCFSVGNFSLDKLVVIEKLSQRLAPEVDFKRLKPIFTNNSEKASISWENVPLSMQHESIRRKNSIPEEIPFTGNKNIKLEQVAQGIASMKDFIAQLSDEDLSCIIRGEGMGSPKVTPGTAGAFAGISENLKSLGIPAGCCSDGPSGMRMDSGVKAFSLPNGTLLACSFNPELSQELFAFTGLEMAVNKIDILLGPGMNIHRHPLNGRNFEYFSEDPLLTGLIAAAQIRGLHSANATGTLKHFCCNNQEFKRTECETVISERAIREIYLKGYEIAVKEAKADAIMTMYGPINGIWAASRYDLNTEILRKEWGFQGIVMTDWWAMMNDFGKEPSRTNTAAMIRSQNDLYMVCPDAAKNLLGDNTLESLESGELTRAELQRCASNICQFIMKTRAFQRLTKTEEIVTVINRPEEDVSFLPDEVIYYPVGKEFTLSLEDVDTSKGSSFVIALEIETLGAYNFSLSGSSQLNEMSQLPVTIFSQGHVAGSFTWNGTNGKWDKKTKDVCIHQKYVIIRLYFGQNGLNLKELNLKFVKPRDQVENFEDYMHWS